jgi:hypothetical protein
MYWHFMACGRIAMPYRALVGRGDFFNPIFTHRKRGFACVISQMLNAKRIALYQRAQYVTDHDKKE